MIYHREFWPVGVEQTLCTLELLHQSISLECQGIMNQSHLQLPHVGRHKVRLPTFRQSSRFKLIWKAPTDLCHPCSTKIPIPNPNKWLKLSSIKVQISSLSSVSTTPKTNSRYQPLIKCKCTSRKMELTTHICNLKS